MDNNKINQLAIEFGIKIAEIYVKVLTASTQAHIHHLTQNSECQQAIANKFNQVFANDTQDVVNDYANQLYMQLRHQADE